MSDNKPAMITGLIDDWNLRSAEVKERLQLKYVPFNPTPEMIVRRLVHSMGYRYRLHRKDLPGKPDIVFPSRRKLILVHGCYWHVHLHYDPACRRAKATKSNGEYWGDKLQRNLDRDAKNLKALQEAGWKTLVLWECKLKDRARLVDRISDFLELA